MCILTQKVALVARAKALCFLNEKGTHQLTVYSNFIDTRGDNIMILPVPNGSTIEIVDISQYKTILEDFHYSFEYDGDVEWSKEKGLQEEKWVNIVPEKKRGNYEFAVVSNFQELKGLDKTYFSIPDECLRKIKKEYSTSKSEYGFIICKILKGARYYNPIAYTHKVLDTGTLFAPTKHEFEYSLEFTGDIPDMLKNKTDTVDWDLELYSFLSNMDNTSEKKWIHKKDVIVKWIHIPEEYRWASRYPINYFSAEGFGDNKNIIFNDLRF